MAETQVQGVPQGLTEEKLPDTNSQTPVQGVPKGLTEVSLPKNSTAGTKVKPMVAGERPALPKKSPEPSFLEKTDTDITNALAPNPKNMTNDFSGLVKTNLIEAPKTLGREIYSGAKTALGMIPGAYHAVVDEPTEEEKQIQDIPKLPGASTGIPRLDTVLGRISGANSALEAVKDYADPKTRPSYEQVLENAPEALGEGAGTVVAGKTAEAAAPAVVRGASKVAAKVTPVLPYAAGVAAGRPFIGAKILKSVGLGKVPEFIEKGKTFGLPEEEARFRQLDERAKEAEKEAAKTQAEVDKYKASTEQGVPLPEDVEKAHAKATKLSEEARAHADIAKEAMEKAKAPKDQPIAADHYTGLQGDIDRMRPLAPKEPEPAAPTPINVKKPGEVTPERVGEVPKEETVQPVDRGRDVPLAEGQGVIKGQPKALPAYEEPTPQNVKKPGEVQPETFPQKPTDIPRVPLGRIDLPNEQGVRLGERLALPEKGTAPRQEVLPPEKPTKATKPERGNIKALTVDEKGNIIDKEETPEGKLGRLLEESLKPGEKPNKLGNIPVREETPSKLGEPERTKVPEAAAKPAELPARYEWEIPEHDWRAGHEAEGSTEESHGWQAGHEPEKPVAKETPKEEPKVETERTPEATDAEAKVQEQVANLTDQKLIKLAKAHGIDDSEYDFSKRDEKRHRVDRERLVRDITAKMGNDEVLNIARNAERFDNPDTSGEAKANRAEKVFPRLRGPVDQFGNPTVRGGSQAASVATSADEYNKQEGLPEIKPEKVERDNRAAQIADDYQKMEHDPENPQVKASYQALIDDVKKQWDYATKNMGIKIEPTDTDPYKSYEEMRDDVENNGTMKVWRGGNPLQEDHPLGKIDPDTGESYNTMFRAVHDIFGHVAQDHDFSEPGEESAWNVHRQMMTPEAVPAMTSETRGQTSWFYNNEAVRNGEPLGKFAEQKAGLLPEYANERTPDANKVLDHIKSRKDYAVLQAENPNNERISDAENAKRNREMVAELRKAGYEPVPVEGNTKDVEGQKEHAFFVPGITPEDAVKFGKKYDQAAILTTDGLHDLKTDKVNPADTKNIILGDEARKQPYFTKVGDQDFSVPIDFSKTLDKGKPGTIKAFHYSNENGLTELDPEKFNANAISPEAKRAKQFPEQAVKQTFLGTDKYQEKPIQGRAHKYAAELDPSKYYDLEKDLEGLIQEAGKLAADKGHYGDAAVSSYLDKLVKDKGYAGHIDQSGVVRSFEKVPVTKVNAKGSPIDEFGNPTVSGGSQSVSAKLPKLAEEHLTPEEKAGVLKTPRTTEKFVETMSKLPEVKEFVDAAVSGQGARKWYQRSTAATKAIAAEAPEYFSEPGDHEKFTGLLASSSPRQAVAMNIREALNAWKEYVDAGRPEGKVLEKLLRDNFTNKGGKVPNAMKALNGEPLWPDLSKNEFFKVPSFRDNLMGLLHKVTNDGWMALFSGLDAKTLGDPSNYHPISVLTREAAKQLNWEPAEAQAAIWSFVKMFKDKNMTAPENIKFFSEDMADIVKHDPETRSILQRLKVNLDQLDKRIDKTAEGKPEITIRPSFTIADSTRKLGERIKNARGEAPIPKDSGLFDNELKPYGENEDTSFNPNRFRTQTTNKLGKIGKK